MAFDPSLITDDHILAELTPEMRDIAGEIGLEPTLKMIDELGGWNKAYVPHAPTIVSKSRLVAAIGLDAAARLASIMPGEYLRVPTCKAALCYWLARRGMADSDLVKYLRIDHGNIFKLRRRIMSSVRAGG